jgi:hypothetical protein
MNSGQRVRVGAILVAAALVGIVSPAQAQDDDSEISEQIWFDYNPRWTFPSNLELYGDLGVRTELGAQGWGRVVVRPGVRGPVGPFRLSGGIGGFLTVNESASNRFELRPFQGIAASWPNKRLRIDHYARFEERFEWEIDDGTLDASFRFRYRLQTGYTLSGFNSNVSWRVLVHIEAFATLAGNAGQFDEKVRIGAGVERNFGSVWRARIDLTWQKTGLIVTGAPTDDLYIRVRIFQSWMQ